MDSVSSEPGGGVGAEGSAMREEGTSLLRQGRFAEAAASLTAATTADPSDETSWRLLGGAYASQGDYERAAEAFQRAIALAPSNARNYYNLGLALEALERTDDARASFTQALRIDPTYSAAQTRLDALGGNSWDSRPLDATLIAEPPTRVEYATTYFREAERQSEQPIVPEPPSRYSNDSPNPGISNMGFAAEPAISATPLSPQSGVPQPMLGDVYEGGFNNSGMRAGAPPEVAVGWNWGAFYLNWIWLLNHNQVGFGIGMFFASFIPIVHLGLAIYLGIKGNELGWSNRRFSSIQDYKACQTIWAKWALGVFIANFCIVSAWFAIVILAAATAASRAH